MRQVRRCLQNGRIEGLCGRGAGGWKGSRHTAPTGMVVESGGRISASSFRIIRRIFPAFDDTHTQHLPP